MPGRFFTVENRVGNPVQRGDIRITPVARSWRLQLGDNLGLIWNRPAAVMVEAAGSRQVIRIPDITRLAQWSIWGLALAVLLAAWLGIRSREGQTSKGA